MICFISVIVFLVKKFGFLTNEDRPRVQKWAIFFIGRLSIGLFTALIFWFNPERNLKFLLSGGLSLSIKSIRCIFMLVSLQFFGKAGRSAIKTILFTLIITGPLTNLSKNALEINRVFVCSSVLAYNLTKTHIDLMILPFRAAIEDLRNISQVTEAFDIVNQVVDPLVQEIELDDDTESSVIRNTSESSESSPRDAKSISENYSKKLSQRCLEQLEKGRDACADTFSGIHEQCREKLPGFLENQFCWMMDIESICLSKIDNKTKELCTPKNVLDDSFGKNYLDLLSEREEFSKEIEGVSIDYSFNESNIIEEIRNVDEYKTDLANILEDKKTVLVFLLKLMDIIFAFTYIKVMIRSILYLYSYLMELDFENIYITTAFREIDQNRAQKGQRNLLPLKKFERVYLVDPFEKRRIQNDYRNLIYHLLKFFLELIAVSVFILLDWILVVALEVVAAHGEVDFTQNSEIEVQIEVSGEGMMASVIGNIISGFSVNQTVEIFEDNKECLPNPSKLFTIWYLQTYGLFLVILIMIYNESYTHRLLLLICVFLYPVRQEERSNFLYSKILLGRRDRFQHMKRILEEEIMQNDEGSLDIPFKEIQGEFVDCPTEGCRTVYCDECWIDLGGACILCGGETGSSM
ncbi:protein sneaky [Phlebotomus papatasi]|uniref:protein sneaky n=1 Tax=Phlebotomus papatasi TaxID=29031 RepID=UPI002483350C|nr:protein sneaky [Phlebotomus papatasi]